MDHGRQGDLAGSGDGRRLAQERLGRPASDDGHDHDGHDDRYGAGARVAPTSFAQERLWFLDQFQPGLSVYNMPAVMHLPGQVDVGVLEAVLAELARRHEAFRTSFVARGGRPAQLVVPEVDVPLAVVDVSGLGPGDREAERARVVANELARPFDLSVPPLARATLVRSGPTDHQFILNMHHIVSDGWSVGVLQRELTALYDAFAAGRPSPLPAPTLTYGDFARWQREHLQGEVLDELVAYWRERLAGAPAVLELPTDRPRPPVQSFAGATHTFTLPSGLAAGLDGLARREGATLFMALLAGFVALLHRYADVDDVVVGTPIANRTRAEFEGLVGFFVNTLVLRTDCSGDPGFAELLGRVREVTLGAYAHQDLPFEKLVEELRPERDLSHNPLFQVMFAFQNAPAPSGAGGPEPSGPSTPAAGVDTPGTAKFDLSLAVAPSRDGLDCAFEYATDLFDAETVARMAGHFRTLLSSAVAGPRRPVSRLALLTAAERRQLLVDWNRTERAFPDTEGLHQLFEAQVARTPDAVAVVAGGERLTYAELNRRANRLARHLRGIGVGLEEVVGLYLDRSVEMVVAMLAVMKAGGAYLPLDVTHPAARLQFVLDDAGARTVLTVRGRAVRLPCGRRVVHLDDPDEGLHAGDDANVDDDADVDGGARGEHLVYVMYTSGSTGQPKGVMVEHRGVANCMIWMQDAFPLTSDDRVLFKENYCFDATVWELFWPLLHGAGVVVVEADRHLDPPYLVELVHRERVSIMYWVSSLLPFFLDEPRFASCPSLRHVFCGGEALTPTVLRRYHDLHVAPLHNWYGPTEASIGTTWWTCDPDHVGNAIPIGRPINNTRAYVLDRNREPVPRGMVGELYLGGVCVSRGYLNRPDLTAESFLDDPFSPEAGARMYRTGDLVRYRPDGNLEFLGRADHQVKIRGQRIELREVEHAISAHPAVRNVAVVAVDEHLPAAALVAYVVPASESGVSPGDLRAFLELTLPRAAIPSAFVMVPDLPLTSTGKLDRRALPAPGADAYPTEVDHVPPRDAVEEVLADIWSEVLGADRVGVHDNFFALGGHSLLATQVVSRVRDRLHVDMSLRAMFEAPTIEQLAPALAAESGDAERLRKEAEHALDLDRHRGDGRDGRPAAPAGS